jgi:hypothetical protein
VDLRRRFPNGSGGSGRYLKRGAEMTLFLWLKHYFWRDTGWSWSGDPWAVKWGDPFVAYQEGCISKGKLCEILTDAVERYQRVKLDALAENAQMKEAIEWACNADLAKENIWTWKEFATELRRRAREGA